MSSAGVSPTEEREQAVAFDKTTEKGVDGGLFQACMKSIRSTHITANRLRTGLVVAGLFTDQTIYREVIVLFYAATRALESNLLKCKGEDEICDKLLSLGYRFAPQYEKDLQFLYPKDAWQQEVDKVLETASPGAKSYLETIRSMKSGEKLAGAAFCLWGALIIGGGAAAMPRVEALCGKEATNLFQDVTGPGRNDRKAKFVAVWDDLVKKKEDPRFQKIVVCSQECMQGNNHLIASVKRNPWWLKYIVSTAVAVGAVGVYFLLQPGKQQEGP